ncbi:hypothetical protein AAHA92_33864 [Salvia divinorum]|uniref:Secreted protein n=1 Tax=Salvia divinorum TaxID=28513 RepID=A0ABD1FH40_SALDI
MKRFSVISATSVAAPIRSSVCAMVLAATARWPSLYLCQPPRAIAIDCCCQLRVKLSLTTLYCLCELIGKSEGICINEEAGESA